MSADRQDEFSFHSTCTSLPRLEGSICPSLMRRSLPAVRELPKCYLRRRIVLERSCPSQQISQLRMAVLSSSKPHISAKRQVQRSFPLPHTSRSLRVTAAVLSLRIGQIHHDNQS